MAITEKMIKEQEEINAAVNDYLDSQNSGDKVRKIKTANFMYSKIYDKNGLLYTSIYKNLHNYKVVKHNSEENDEMIKMILNDLLVDYKAEANENFCAYINTYAKFKILDLIKSKYSHYKDETGNAVPLWRDVTYPKGGNDNQKTSFFDNLSSDENVEEKIELKASVRLTLIYLLINMNKHLKAKALNDIKISYYKIFFTEYMIQFISESKNMDYFNNAEIYENSDKAFVKFISYSEYKSVEDLLNIQFKKFSDVIDDYKDKEKLIDVPCENEIITTYRFKNGLDEKKVANANVTLQRNAFKEKFIEIYKSEDNNA